MIGQINVGGGVNPEDFINGVIQEAKAQGVVTAGDFVRFLSDYSETGEIKDTELRSMSNYGNIISAVVLDKNKVFIAHSTSSVDTLNYLYGVVCTISKNTVSVGNDVKLNTTQNSGSTISAVALNDSKVFIAHLAGSSSTLGGIVCIINGTTISVGEQTQLSGRANSGKVISAVKLDEGKVFIAHSYDSSYYLSGIVCTISGTTVTKGADTQLSTTASTGNLISAVTLNENKVLIAHRYSSNRNLYGLVCTISGTTITKGTDNYLTSTSVNSGYAVALNENKAVIIYSDSDSNSLRGIICTISGTTVQNRNNIGLSSTNTALTISLVALNENKIQIIHRNSNSYLYSMLCSVDDIFFTIGTDIQLSSVANSGYAISAVALNEKDIFIAHSGGANYYLYGMILGYLENRAKTITASNETIEGIAITDGQAGEIVQVKKPDETFICSFNASVTAEGKSVTWNNVILTHRKVLDGDTKVFSPAKSIEIGGIVYEFKFFIHYEEDTAVASWTGWKFGWEFSPKLYSPSATTPQNTITYASPIQTQITRSSKYYTEQLSGGVEITLTETETPIFD